MAAIDATGLESRHVSVYFSIRRAAGDPRAFHCQHWRQRYWPKLTTVIDTASHLVLAAVPELGPSQDSPGFTPAMRQASAQLRRLGLTPSAALADAAYDAEHNHRLCHEELGIATTAIKVNPRRTRQSRRWPVTRYRRAMRRAFPRTLYQQRWQAESVFSRLKRHLGAALTARRTSAQDHELLLRVLTHNVALLWRTAAGFQQSNRTI